MSCLSFYRETFTERPPPLQACEQGLVEEKWVVLFFCGNSSFLTLAPPPFLMVGQGGCNSSATAWDHVLGGVYLVKSGASSQKANAGLLAQPPLSSATIRFLGSMVGWERSFWYTHVCLWLYGMHWEDGSGYIHMRLEHVQPTGGPGTA